jgi:hypothetical protein
MTWALEADGTGTSVELTYAVGGYRPGGFADLAPIVDGVVREQLLRLKAFVETGKPDAPGFIHTRVPAPRDPTAPAWPPHRRWSR